MQRPFFEISQLRVGYDRQLHEYLLFFVSMFPLPLNNVHCMQQILPILFLDVRPCLH
jgi:hypothetical protein